MTLTRPFSYLHRCVRIAHIAIALSYHFFSVFAQENFFEKIYTTENGLAHGSVITIAQDSIGFLWIGMWDGLSRFDGYEFHNYFHDPNDSTTIPTFSVQQLKVDKYNNVWILTLSDNLCRYNRSADNFETIDLQKDSVIAKRHINVLAINNEGELMTGGSNGIALFDNSSQKFMGVSCFDEQGKLMENQVDGIYFDLGKKIWITIAGSYCSGIFDRQRRTIQITKKYPAFSFREVISPGGLHRYFDFTNDVSGEPWFVSNVGCKKLINYEAAFIPDSETFPNISLKTQKPVWFKTSDKIMVFTGNGEYSEIKLNKGEYPFTLYIASDNTIWYSTITSAGISTGLHRYQKTPDYFHHYFTESGGKPVSVYSIEHDKDKNLLIGSRGNPFIAKIDTAGHLTRINELSRNEEIQSSHPRVILADSSELWVGYMRQRLDQYDYETNKWSSLMTDPDPGNPLEPLSFRALYKIGKGDLLIGSYGLFRFRQGTQKPFAKLWPSVGPNQNIFCIVEAPDKRVWVGTNSFILRLSDQYEIDTVFRISDKDYTVEDFCFYDDGTLWLALLGAGIEHFNPETGQREFFTTSDGLSNNTTYSILKDKKGNLWISTDNGISRFNPHTRKFRIYGYSDGLRIHEFNSDASLQTPDGNMYFGGMGGVVGFNPDSADDNDIINTRKKLIITEFRVSGNPRYFPKPVYLSDSVFLSRGDNNFGVTFACIDYRNADKTNYRYQLIGHLDNWVETDHFHRSINFAGLSSGKYTLLVEATDPEGNWNKRINLTVFIPAKFYQTTWFMILLGVFTLLLVGFLVFLNNCQIRLKEKQKQQYLKLETVRGQMNPHFIFNSLNSINYFIAKSDRLSANRYIANFSKLIRAFLNNMSQDYIPLDDELTSIRDYLALEYLRFGDKFEYEILTEKVSKTDHLEVFPGMVQPFIENAIWHGVRGLHHKGLIRVVFESGEDHSLHCIITDDGIGRKLSDQIHNKYSSRKSRGISLVRERIQIINHLEKKKYRIEIQDLYPGKKECGTKVFIDIPTKNQVLKSQN